MTDTGYADQWDTQSLQRDFKVLSFVAPYVSVVRRADQRVGTLEFAGDTTFSRVYFNFVADDTP